MFRKIAVWAPSARGQDLLASVAAVIRNPALRALRATLAPPDDTSASSISASSAPTDEAEPPSLQQSTTPPKTGTARSVATTLTGSEGFRTPAGRPVTQGLAVRHHASRSRPGVTSPTGRRGDSRHKPRHERTRRRCDASISVLVALVGNIPSHAHPVGASLDTAPHVSPSNAIRLTHHYRFYDPVRGHMAHMKLWSRIRN